MRKPRFHLNPKTSNSNTIVGGSKTSTRKPISRLSLATFIILFAAVGSYLWLFSGASSLTADFNDDNAVNVTDLSILATNWGRAGMSASTGDTNSDGTVNIYDLSALASQWGQTVSPTPTPTVTPTPTPTGQPANSINVKDYGAVGDGVTDDYPAIVAASNAAGSAKVLYFPIGTYLMNTRFKPVEGQHLSGEGIESWLNGPVQVASYTQWNDMRIGRDLFDTSLGNCHDITFTRVKFHGGGGQTSNGGIPNPAAVISIGSAWNGVNKSVNNVVFDDCVFERNIGIENVDKTLKYDTISLFAAVKTGDTVVSNILFKNSIFEGGGTSFIVEMWQDFNQLCQVGYRNINFEGNTFYAAEAASIDYSGATAPDGTPSSGYSHVTGNTFLGNGTGSNPKWATDVTSEKGAGYITVSNNRHIGGKGQSYGLGGPYNSAYPNSGGHYTVTNNDIDATAPGSIQHEGFWTPYVITGGKDNTITGNTIITAYSDPRWPTMQYDAIKLSATSSNSVATGNIIVGGKLTDEGTNNTISPNTFYPAGTILAVSVSNYYALSTTQSMALSNKL
jgi:hypothetical protein